MRPREPRQLRRGKAFHRRVQKGWLLGAEGRVYVEKRIATPGGRAGRADLLVEADDRLAAVVEIKASDWDRMTLQGVRRNARRHARQIWDYIESQLAEQKNVNPGVVFPKAPKFSRALSPRRVPL